MEATEAQVVAAEAGVGRGQNCKWLLSYRLTDYYSLLQISNIQKKRKECNKLSCICNPDSTAINLSPSPSHCPPLVVVIWIQTGHGLRAAPTWSPNGRDELSMTGWSQGITSLFSPWQTGGFPPTEGARIQVDEVYKAKLGKHAMCWTWACSRHSLRVDTEMVSHKWMQRSGESGFKAQKGLLQSQPLAGTWDLVQEGFHHSQKQQEWLTVPRLFEQRGYAFLLRVWKFWYMPGRGCLCDCLQIKTGSESLAHFPGKHHFTHVSTTHC